MSDLPLRSVEVRHFRGIGSLHLPDLGRVNLFVGKNNAGKTALLEALHLFFFRNSGSLPAVLFGVMHAHTDMRSTGFAQPGKETDTADLQIAIEAVDTLFFRSSDRTESSIQVLHAGEYLRVWTPWILDSARGTEEEAEGPVLVDPDAPVLEAESEANGIELPLRWFVRRVSISRHGARAPALLIGPGGFQPIDTRRLWDRIVVSGNESLAEDAVRILVPDLERILLIGEGPSRTILCKLSGLARPLPIKSMGDGVNRVFGLAIALVHARGGALLIDEVENGLHYSVHREVWEAIFELAEKLDVQIFATTHSWEAVVAFQHAANRSRSEGFLYRLDRDPDGSVRAVRYTEEEVAIAAEQQIEVR